ncbi:fatty acid desaturase family protein [Neisseria sp. Ec49-e6-T10]|uniref:fatty acid desaturase family protein n=1 Tax=Neisseria sp. Ec49-e6-T10 TaxID=3140744 RepID=UPI003EBAB80C
MPQPTRRLSFPPRTEFFKVLQKRINDYFDQNQVKQTGNSWLYFKAFFAFSLYIGGYIGLVFFAQTWLSGILFALMLTNGMILVAFNVMHDGAHGSFSSKKWVNWLAGASMDLLGSSQTLWQQKHNMLHHTYTNITGKDDDIELGLLMRFSPHQTWHPWHRFQHIYAPFLYSLLTLFLAVFSDFYKLVTNRISDTPLQKRKWWELPYFTFTKIAYIGYALILPMFFHPISLVLLYFFCIHFFFGFILSLVFQLAHTVDLTEFPKENEQNKMCYDWAEHQLRTTANFAIENPLVRFYTGGLNQQVEHHLFHKVSHIHYYSLSKIVQETCLEYDMPYHKNNSLTSAVLSHFRFLKQMGRKPTLTN